MHKVRALIEVLELFLFLDITVKKMNNPNFLSKKIGNVTDHKV